MLNNLFLYLNTIKYLNSKQIFYQIFYRLNLNKIFSFNNIKIEIPKKNILWKNYLNKPSEYFDGNTFVFLNKKKKFDVIDWDYVGNDKLWSYNLNYFNFLLQDGISKKEGLTLIFDYIDSNNKKIGTQPYPTSLRIVNWIKFLSNHKIIDQKINLQIIHDTNKLLNNIEYHIQGNHLFENGITLLFSGVFFENKKIIEKGLTFINEELDKQILNDGGHFELSPMYQNIVLRGLLDCICLMQLNKINNQLQKKFASKASLMLGWALNISNDDGTYPQVNDSIKGITNNIYELKVYAKNLDIIPKFVELSGSGYRRWKRGYFNILIDVGQIGPKFLTAHSHADTFSFELYFKNIPIIVDPGTSTYNKSKIRELERSTKYHNTININNIDSSEVWHVFRTADRAEVEILKEDKYCISAHHNGYRKINTDVYRSFKLFNEKFVIKDKIEPFNNQNVQSNIHFHPNIKPVLTKNKLVINEDVVIEFNGYRKIQLHKYKFCEGFNTYKNAYKLVSIIEDKSSFEIKNIK